MKDLAKSGLQLPIAAEDGCSIPLLWRYALRSRCWKGADAAAAVIIRGQDSDADEKRFIQSVMEEVRKKAGITEEQMAALPVSRLSIAAPLTGNGCKMRFRPSIAMYHMAAAGALRLRQEMYTDI